MKYLKIIIFSGALVLLAYACNKSFLNRAPIGATDPAALANKNGVNGLLIGAYALLDGFGGAGGSWSSAGSNWVYGSVCGTESHKGSSAGDQPDAVPLENFTPQGTNSYMESKWQMVYDAISRCNDVIRTAALAKDISSTDLAAILGQVKALRAWYHMDAKKMWNKVPFIDETITYGAGNYFVANTTDIWPQIETDLTFAVANLPTHFADAGRINKYGAEAILAKAYMFEGKYAAAKPLLEDIINSDVYSLTANYHDNFNILTKNSTESLLAAQSSVNDGGGGNNGNWGDVLNFPYGGSPGTCCGFNQPSQWLVDHFKTDAVTGLPDLVNYDATHVTSDEGLLSTASFTPYAGTVDPRLDWTVGRRGIPYLDWGLHPGNDWIRAQTDAGPYSPIKNVYPNALESKYTDASFWSSGSTAMNTNLIRYADVLLWDAEVEVEIGSLHTATTRVNQIRTRAANPAGFVHTYISNGTPQGGFTNTPAANYKIGLYTADFPDQATGRNAVRYERFLELGMEGHRHFDLVRWGIAATEINRYLAHEKVNLPSISYMSAATFTAGVNEYWPIPQNEIDKSNGKLVQNPGYH